jgi:hypothetical protein
MQTKEFGIILKKLDGGTTFSVLCDSAGKIVISTAKNRFPQRLTTGSTISFFIEKNGMVVTPTNIEILSFCLHQPTDMYWCHHLLELCHFFAPLNQPTEDLFVFLSRCLSLPTNHTMSTDEWNMIKKLSIGGLLLFFGFFPPKKLEPLILGIKKTLTSFIDLDQQPFLEFAQHSKAHNKTYDADLDSWLLECIQSHPRAHMFKTMGFVYNNPQS